MVWVGCYLTVIVMVTMRRWQEIGFTFGLTMVLRAPKWSTSSREEGEYIP